MTAPFKGFVISCFLGCILWRGTAAGAEGPEREVRFEFEGTIGLSASQLDGALRAIREDMEAHGIDEGALEDAAYELEREYASRGYRQARARASIANGAEPDGGATPAKGAAKVVVRFSIEEGPRSIVRGLSFEGNVHYDSAELARCFQWDTTGRFGLGDDVFTESSLAAATGCVDTRYQLEGFYFVTTVAAITEDELGNVLVHVRVEEGPRVLLLREPRFVFVGPSAVTEEELLEVLAVRLPEIYTPRLPPLLRGKIAEHYRNLGYRFVDVQVDPEIDAGSAEAELTFRIEQGVAARVASVVPSGNDTTQDWVITNRVKLRAGDLYSEERIRESYRSLIASGLFSMVSIDSRLVEGSKDDLEIGVDVKERSRYRASFLVGYGSYEYLRGKVVLEDANLFGTGHSLTLTGKGSFKGYGASARYLNPYVFSDRISHTAEARYEQRQNPSYTSVEFGGETGLGYRLTDNLQTGLAYQLRQSNAYGYSESIPPELRADVLLSGFRTITGFEYRDSLVNPLRGSSHWLSLEYFGEGLGSDLDFIRLTAASTWVFPVIGDLRLVAAARAGAIVTLVDSQVIPVQERFFLGGESTIRSYKQDKAGPTIGGAPIGGEAFTCFNLELRFPLGLLEDLQGAAFGDAGSLTEDVEDFGSGRYYLGVGGGVRYNTPFGPLRLDLAFNPDRRTGEDLFVVHFGLGYPF